MRISLDEQRQTSQQGMQHEGMIEEIFPRRNLFLRPKVANVEQAILILAAKDPKPDWLLMDRMLAMAAYNGVRPVICLNKCDLLEKSAQKKLEEDLLPYRKAEFLVLLVSAQTGYGITQLKEVLSGKFSVLAGPSGIGKSSLLNTLFPKLDLPTGEISQRLQRGKHTTRHVKIMVLEDHTLVADTPGFSLLDLPQDLNERHLVQAYPDFVGLGRCRFDGCLHDQEPDCVVKEAVNSGKIAKVRYERYLRLLNEIREREDLYR